ncbi:hypothetical protein OF83DRAFT_1178926 [Amylostereum chailletii]|nr:hypothetical protein OF83DRAFT_1178926 [Amylostereum chailletii]
MELPPQMLPIGDPARIEFKLERRRTGNTTAHPYETLDSLARSAADTLIVPRINASTGTIDGFDNNLSADTVVVLSLRDFYSNNTSHKDIVANSVGVFPQTHPGYYVATSFWGLASYYAYAAYGDTSFLNTAVRLWNQSFPYFVNSTQAADGTSPARDVSIAPGSNCSSILGMFSGSGSIAGAVFTSVDNASDTSFDATSATTFMALSAHLFEQSHDTKYLDAAELTGAFINGTLYHGGVVVTSFDNATWSERLNDVVSSTVLATQWTRPSDGVITAGEKDDPDGTSVFSAGKGIFIRGLHTARTRADPESPIASFIDSFINVQLNAILGIAAAHGPDYATNWALPPTAAPVSFGGDVSVLDVFNAALDLATPASTTSPAPSGGSSQNTVPFAASAHSPHPVGAIVGGAVGGLVGAITVLVVFCLCRRRRRSSALGSQPRSHDMTHPTVEPFLETSPFPASSPTWRSMSKADLLRNEAAGRHQGAVPSSESSAPPIPTVSASQNAENGLQGAMRDMLAEEGGDGDGEHLEGDGDSTRLMRELIVLLRQRGQPEPPPEYPSSL